MHTGETLHYYSPSSISPERPPQLGRGLRSEAGQPARWDLTGDGLFVFPWFSAVHQLTAIHPQGLSLLSLSLPTLGGLKYCKCTPGLQPLPAPELTRLTRGQINHMHCPHPSAKLWLGQNKRRKKAASAGCGMAGHSLGRDSWATLVHCIDLI